MEEYTEFLKEYLGERRNITKDVYKIVRTIKTNILFKSSH